MSAERHWTNAVAAAEHYKTHAKRLAEVLERLTRIVEKYQIVATGPGGETIVDGKYMLVVKDARVTLDAWKGAQ